jgi:hypothetical protein
VGTATHGTVSSQLTSNSPSQSGFSKHSEGLAVRAGDARFDPAFV